LEGFGEGDNRGDFVVVLEREVEVKLELELEPEEDEDNDEEEEVAEGLTFARRAAARARGIGGGAFFLTGCNFSAADVQFFDSSIVSY